MVRKGYAFIAATLLAGCSLAPPDAETAFGEVAIPGDGSRSAIGEIVAAHNVTTALIGVIDGGALVWTAAYGQEAPGIPADINTRMNVASITKTVVAETALRLADDGAINLDEPMADYWVDPDIAGDPRTQKLTARHALTHSTGFPNWRFFRADGTLVFMHDPGAAHSYSGEGMEYLARYMEAKLDRTLPELVTAEVFEPIGMMNSAIAANREATGGLAQPRDADGTFYGYFCRPPRQGGACLRDGSYSAAGGMSTSVPDYAAFLKSVLRSEGYGAPLAAERSTVLVAEDGDDAIVRCTEEERSPCPTAQGYGLGFEILTYDDETVIGHTGWDWSELTAAYAYEESGDGVIVLLNTQPERGLPAMTAILRLLDPASPFLAQFERWERREAAKAAKAEE
ncbi:serine hydrolase domain-containing protein [Eilatimonas milleporae]|uniref:CubicO group peptidase (Beta-lactamase class C family) n=1 Tax=Eilatimonas milleporae TaxID=911205 RepID=A0A3M0CHR3_9PROT|nr:serine hydrolase domain-containing protein [Eilatimonas milleporae]RMB02763.1 CubicO group peptidase (beta-lactamase class C family) [Eilatimonas milleporae]